MTGARVGSYTKLTEALPDGDQLPVATVVANKTTRWNKLYHAWCLVCLLLILVVVCLTIRSVCVFYRTHYNRGPPLNGRAALGKFDGHHGHYEQRLPQCIVIGVRKCGTRALLEFLNLHPKIVAAQEEIHFFDNDDNYRNGLDWYRERMPPSNPEQVTIEKSPAYFITNSVPQRIYAMNSSIKLVMIVRNPTTRTISDYTQVHYNKIARNKSHQPFEELAVDRETGLVNLRLKAVSTSIYQRHLERWLKVFDISQILTLDGDRLIVDPITEVRKVETFLGLGNHITQKDVHYNRTKGFFCKRQNGTDRCLGNGKGRKHPNVRRDVITKLNQFFHPHNERLFQMTGIRLNWPSN